MSAYSAINFSSIMPAPPVELRHEPARTLLTRREFTYGGALRQHVFRRLERVIELGCLFTRRLVFDRLRSRAWPPNSVIDECPSTLNAGVKS
jgi:hypothetical protein